MIPSVSFLRFANMVIEKYRITARGTTCKTTKKANLRHLSIAIHGAIEFWFYGWFCSVDRRRRYMVLVSLARIRHVVVEQVTATSLGG